jgi:hypothetical protein
MFGWGFAQEVFGDSPLSLNGPDTVRNTNIETPLFVPGSMSWARTRPGSTPSVLLMKETSPAWPLRSSARHTASILIPTTSGTGSSFLEPYTSMGFPVRSPDAEVRSSGWGLRGRSADPEGASPAPWPHPAKTTTGSRTTTRTVHHLPRRFRADDATKIARGIRLKRVDLLLPMRPSPPPRHANRPERRGFPGVTGFSEVRLEVGTGLVVVPQPPPSDATVFDEGHHPPVSDHAHGLRVSLSRVVCEFHYVAPLDLLGEVAPG